MEGGEVEAAGPHVAEEEPALVLGLFQLMWLVLLQQEALGWQMEPCDLCVGRCQNIF